MKTAFKYLRALTAILLLLTTIFKFILDLNAQRNGPIDGPLANHISYHFAIEKIMIAAWLSLLLVVDFKFQYKPLTRKIINYGSLLSILLSFIGIVNIFQQQFDFAYGGFFFEAYLFQFSYFLTSIVIFTKTRLPNKNEGNHA